MENLRIVAIGSKRGEAHKLQFTWLDAHSPINIADNASEFCRSLHH